jgi:hypothetical protein
MICKTLHRKLKIEEREPHKKTDRELVCCGMVCSSCSTSGNRRVTLVVSHKIVNDDRMATSTKRNMNMPRLYPYTKTKALKWHYKL